MLTMLTQTHRAVMDGSINRVYRACGAAGGQLAVGADPGLTLLGIGADPEQIRHRFGGTLIGICGSRPSSPQGVRAQDLVVAAAQYPLPAIAAPLEDSWFMFLGEGAFLAVIRHWQSSFVRHQALDAMQCGAIHENQSSVGKGGILNSRAELGNMSLDI